MVVSELVRRHIRLAIFLILMLLIIGSVLFYNAYQYQQDERKISTLKVTTGTVILSSYTENNETVIQYNCKSNHHGGSTCSTDTSVFTRANIEFRYKFRINQMQYYSSNYGVCDSSPTSTVVSSNPVGTTVKVYYNPANPYDAYLNVNDCPESNFRWGLLCIISSIFSLGYVFKEDELKEL